MKSTWLILPIISIALFAPTLKIRVKRLEEENVLLAKRIAALEASQVGAPEVRVLERRIAQLQIEVDHEDTVGCTIAIRDRIPAIFVEKLNSVCRFDYAASKVKVIAGSKDGYTWMFVADAEVIKNGKSDSGIVAVFFKPRLSIAMSYEEIQSMDVDDIRIGKKILYQAK